uniref:Fission protein ELM1 n=1 Tax=Candidatus Kentrum sp. TC TaxID=2126339 RepID=A0A450YZF7_9GAMM|nr:MAG: hypothetical protein BECKTC1821E_GA0114239_10728 [Candidatus Kentron sp. TC]
MSQKLKVWILSDRVPGHVNQAHGLVKWMSDRYEISYSEISVCIRAMNPLRFWMPSLLRQGRRGARIVISAHRLRIPAPRFVTGRNGGGIVEYEKRLSIGKSSNKDVDLIISAGGNTSFANAALAAWLNCDNIFIGSRRRLDSKMFKAHLTLEPVGKPNNIVMELAPTLVDPVKLRQEAPRVKKKLRAKKERPVYVLIIGGDGAGFRYQRDDWLRFVHMMKRCRDQDQAQWLVTTSRRTTRKNDALIKESLRNNLPEGSVLEQVIWSDAPRKVMLSYLSAADRIFVTADSMSMITECISTEKPVTLLYPRHFLPTERYRKAIDRFIRLGFCASDDEQHRSGNNANMHDIKLSLLDRLEECIEALGFCNYRSSVDPKITVSPQVHNT